MLVARAQVAEEDLETIKMLRSCGCAPGDYRRDIHMVISWFSGEAGADFPDDFMLDAIDLQPRGTTN